MANQQKQQLGRRFGFTIGQVALIFATINQQLKSSYGHGTMLDPVSRNSLWRVDASAPVNYNDIELFCGGLGVG